MAAKARPEETKKEIIFKGKKYIPVTELQAYLNNPLLAKSGIKDKAYKIRRKLEEGKDFIFLGSKEYSELMGYTSAKGGTLFTISGFNRAKAIANEMGYHEPTFDELPEIKTPEDYVDPRDTWVEQIRKQEELEKLEKEMKKKKPKAKVIRRPVTLAITAEAVQQETKEEVKEEPKSIQPKLIKATEKATEINVNMPNLKCDMNLMFERFMDVQLRQIEMWNKQIESLSGMVKDLIDLKVSKPESFELETTKLTDIDNNKTEPVKKVKEEVIEFNPPVDFATWRKERNKEVDLILSLKSPKYPTANVVFSEAYKYLTAVYTVVWEQAKKEFKAANNRTSNSTAELCWFIEQSVPNHRNLLESVLNTFYNETLKEMGVLNEN